MLPFFSVRGLLAPLCFFGEVYGSDQWDRSDQSEDVWRGSPDPRLFSVAALWGAMCGRAFRPSVL